MGIDAFGLNCSAGPEQMLLQLKRLREYARVPLIAKPNAGMPIIENGETVYRCTGEEFTALVPEFLAAGVAVFGGCCGTTAAHIAALARALDGVVITPPAPQHTNELPAATEKLPFPLPADIAWHTVVDLTGDAEETLTAALDSGETVLALRIASWDDVQALADYQYMLTKPVCFVCDDTQLLEAALRAYTTAPCRRTRSCPCAPNMVSCCKKTRPPRALFFYSLFPVQPLQLPPHPEQPAHPPFFRARRALRRASTPHSATSASSTQSIQLIAAALPQRKRCTPPATPLRIAAAPRPPF